MTHFRPDAAYIRTQSHPQIREAVMLSAFDEEVCDVLCSAHTVHSATKALAPVSGEAQTDLEDKVTASMIRLLEAERIELSPEADEPDDYVGSS